jgi:hypothetical protein
MRTQTDLRFERGDPVREYWLAHGEGFALETRRGRVVGHVLDAVLDPDEGRIVSLVVRRTLLGTVPGGKSELPAEQIRAAVPARGAFVLDGADSEARAEERRRVRPSLERARLAIAALARGSRKGASALGVAAACIASALGDGLGIAAARAGPLARHAGVVLAEWLVAAALWVAGVARWSVGAARVLAGRGFSEVRARVQALRSPK